MTEGLFSITHWAILVYLYLFQTDVILSSATLWTSCHILKEIRDLRKLEFLSAVGALDEK